MWTENGMLRTLRYLARRALPERAFLKIDRGDYLFVSNAPFFVPEMRSVPGFIAQRKGSLLLLLPDESHVLRMERRASEVPDELSRSLMRFKGSAIDEENLKLFARGIKLMEAAPSEDEIAAYDKALRQRAALALRGHSSGALYACALIHAKLNAKPIK